MRLVIVLFGLSAAAIVAVWACLGMPAQMPDAPLGQNDKLYCVSYAPFRNGQTPLDPSTKITPEQIEQDIIRLSSLTGCVRTYSVDFGLERIAEIAAKHGVKVLQGLWLSGTPEKDRYQIETAVALANKFPGTIQAVIVGNEVLLRGEMSGADLAATIRAVKARVPVPVTYADVWEFWLRNAEVAAAADFITIHILPYWEDFPIAARYAASHVSSIRRRVAESFVGKEIIIGEFGWPSAGRMREGALPSLSNQARAIQETLATAKRENFRMNVIEAFDQPWKRAHEGTVGGHWGLLDGTTREFKFPFGHPVSNHPNWIWQAAGGIVFAALIFAVAIVSRTRAPASLALWFAVTACATIGGGLIGWTIENVPLESLGTGGWLRSLALTCVAALAPLVGAYALASETPIPQFSRIVGPSPGRARDPLTFLFGVVLIATTILAIVVALGLVFDPRYRDFPFAPLTAAVAPYLLHSLVVRRTDGGLGKAELVAAGLLFLAAVYVMLNETFANWQSLWLCAALVGLAVMLVRVRDVQD